MVVPDVDSTVQDMLRLENHRLCCSKQLKVSDPGVLQTLVQL
jgi:hypothetical protein